MRVPLGTSDFLRGIAETAEIRLVNRYFEADPTNQQDQVALLTRPALRKWLTLATTPVRAVYSQPGSFEESLFAVGGSKVYRIEQDETVTEIGTLGTSTGNVSMAATDTYLFIADGASLHYYTINAYSQGTLTASGAISNAEVVKIGATYYQFTSGDVDTGTPAGSVGSPWLVAVGTTITDALQNLYDAIGDAGTPGTDYSTALTGHTTAAPVSVTSTALVIRAISPGSAGNAIATTETGVNLAWGAATLAGGGATSFSTVTVPDNDGIISVGVIASFTICVVAQGEGKNGRFYWIDPGEVTIDALNFATAERSPDPVWEVVVANDKFWLPGSSTVEVWVPTGDPLAPMQRQQGILFEQGIWEGTIFRLKESLFCVGNDAMPYIIMDRPIPVGTAGVVQRIREAMNAQRAL